MRIVLSKNYVIAQLNDPITLVLCLNPYAPTLPYGLQKFKKTHTVLGSIAHIKDAEEREIISGTINQHSFDPSLCIILKENLRKPFTTFEMPMPLG